MSTKFLTIVAVSSLLMSACQNTSQSDSMETKNTVAVDTPSNNNTSDIPYTLAKNYFVKNTVKKLDNPKIETSEQFDAVFGMATTMGKDGKPTEIDFSKQYVIAVVLPETDLMTTLTPVRLQKNAEGKIILTYKTEVGQKQSFTIMPAFAIIVDKAENGVVELKEEK